MCSVTDRISKQRKTETTGVKELKFSEMDSVDEGLKFKTVSGIIVKTTGVTVYVESTEVQTHEVVITEGVGEGNTYLHNLDSAEQLSA